MPVHFAVCLMLILSTVPTARCQSFTYTDPAMYSAGIDVYDSGGTTGNYADNESKIYNFNCNSGRTVVLNFPTFGFSILAGDSLSVFDGVSGPSQVKICGPCSVTQLTGGKPLGMTGGSAVVTFTSNNSGVSSGYTIQFFCADTYTAVSGTIYDSGGANGTIAAPGNYYQQIICPAGKPITLTFTFMDLPGTYPSQCTSAYLAPVALQQNSLFFFNSEGTTGKYCGAAVIPPFVSLTHRALIHYYSASSSTPRRGYALNYECKLFEVVQVNDPGATWKNIADPGGGYSGNYLTDYHVIYKFSCTPGRRVVFYFGVYIIDSSDEFTIFDGGSTESPVACRKCSSAELSRFYVLSSSLGTIDFQSDSSLTKDGYYFSFYCAAVFSDLTGSVFDVSGGATGNYLKNQDTVQIISCPAFHKIRFSVEFDLATNPQDKLNCWQSTQQQLPHPYEYSQYPDNGWEFKATGIAGPLLSSQHEVLFNFVASATSIPKSGYAINYECEGHDRYTFSDPGDTFYSIWDSGGDTGDYSPNEDIVYHLNCRPGRRVALYLRKYEVDESDALLLYDGNSTAASTYFEVGSAAAKCDMHAFCVLSSSTALLLFQSDSSRENEGYRLDMYCAEEFNKLSGSFTKPSAAIDITQIIKCPLNFQVSFFAEVDILDVSDAPRLAFYDIPITDNSNPKRWFPYSFGAQTYIPIGLRSISLAHVSKFNECLIEFNCISWMVGDNYGTYQVTYSCQDMKGTMPQQHYTDPFPEDRMLIYDNGGPKGNYIGSYTQRLQCREGLEVIIYFHEFQVHTDDSFTILYEDTSSASSIICDPCTYERLMYQWTRIPSSVAHLQLKSVSSIADRGYNATFMCREPEYAATKYYIDSSSDDDSNSCLSEAEPCRSFDAFINKSRYKKLRVEVNIMANTASAIIDNLCTSSNLTGLYKQLTVTGNGAMIRCKENESLFVSDYDNSEITVSDIKFVDEGINDTKTQRTAPLIYMRHGGRFNLFRVQFSNCGSCRIELIDVNQTTLSHCTFHNSSLMGSKNAAVTVVQTGLTYLRIEIINTVVSNCSDYDNGIIAVLIKWDNAMASDEEFEVDWYVENSTFQYNSGSSSVLVVKELPHRIAHLVGGSISIFNSTFTGNSLSRNYIIDDSDVGGAAISIALQNPSKMSFKCNLSSMVSNLSGRSFGGAVYITNLMDVIFRSSSFYDNRGTLGGAVYARAISKSLSIIGLGLGLGLALG